MQNKKIYIFFLLSVLLILNLSIICNASEKKGYVQLSANVDERIKEGKYNIEVGICQVSDDGLSKKIYLYEVNKYKTNITLPEGHYEINYAKVVGDDENEFWFSCNDIDFVIKKDSPAIMYFGLGNVLNQQKNQDNQEDNESEQNEEEINKDVNEETLTKEEIELLRKIGLDFYNDDGTINEEKVSKMYEEEMGETIEDTMKEYDDAHPEEKKEKVEEKKRENKILNFINKFGTLILALIILIVYVILKFKGKLKEN